MRCGSSTIRSPAPSTPRPSAGTSAIPAPGTTCSSAGGVGGRATRRWSGGSRKSSTTSAAATPAMHELLEALRDVEDPEMPVNIVDLGIVYGVRREAGRVVVDLTFTAMGCPAADFILEDVRDRLLREPNVEEVVVNVVWDPPWTSARLTQAGRDALEMWGLAV